MIVVNILLVLNVSAYYSSVAEGTILILAVLGGSLNRGSSPAADYRQAAAPQAAGAAGRDAARAAPARPVLPAAARAARRPRRAPPSWLERHRETLRYALPAYVGFAVVVVGDADLVSATRWPTSATSTRCWSCPPSSPSWRSARARSS